MGFIPDRWLEYSPIQKPIADVPLIAFKTPLSEQYNASSRGNEHGEFVPKEDEFTPAQLLEKIADLGYKLVVVIDLTFTLRYYDGAQQFKGKRGIQYEKVKCEGHKIPNDQVFEKIADVINDVIFKHGRNSKKIVGIHCTHGVNRTGYLVSRYLIDYLGYQPEDAIKAFNESRGHEIERPPYLEDLRSRTPKNLYEEWMKNGKHKNLNEDEDWNENICNFEQSREQFFSHRPDYEVDARARRNDWHVRDERFHYRSRPYRGRYDPENGRSRRNYWVNPDRSNQFYDHRKYHYNRFEDEQYYLDDEITTGSAFISTTSSRTDFRR